MTEGQFPTAALLYLRVSTGGDPSVLTRLLGYRRHVNVIPRRVAADFDLNRCLHVKVDLAGLLEERLTLNTAKIGQNPSVLKADWRHLG